MEDNIQKIEEDESRLYSYLVQLAKSDNGQASVSLFENYLNHKSPDIRGAAIFALLFVLKIKNDNYRTEAIKNIIDQAEDFDLRQWSFSGLAQTYFGEKDLELLKLFYNLLHDEKEDLDIKSTILRGLLNLYGLNTREIFLTTGVVDKVDDKILSKFSKEMSNIKTLILKDCCGLDEI